MIERLSRMADCAGLPKVKMSTPNEFFDEVREDANKLCTWVGELFLELHNGTYTTKAKVGCINVLVTLKHSQALYYYRLRSLIASVKFFCMMWSSYTPCFKLQRKWNILVGSWKDCGNYCY